MIARGVVRDGPNPLKVPVSYHRWPPNYIAPQTRKLPLLVNTEFEKLKQVTDPELEEAIPEDVIMHLLVDTVRCFCKKIGLTATGSKLDMLNRIRVASVTRAKFDYAYTSIYSHSGGWLSGTCLHNVTYAVKFLLRSESPRDYVDILRSLQHVPTVNIIDIANNVPKMACKIIPDRNAPHEGRLAEPTIDNITATEEGRFNVSIPALNDNRPVSSSSETAHPITGMDEKFFLFDWFHQENCKTK